ncbi:unnamed protein product, partial [marine sediment metagenome]
VENNPKRFCQLVLHYREKQPSDRFGFKSKDFGNIYNLAEFKKLAEKFMRDKAISKSEKETLENFIESIA